MHGIKLAVDRHVGTLVLQCIYIGSTQGWQQGPISLRGQYNRPKYNHNKSIRCNHPSWHVRCDVLMIHLRTHGPIASSGEGTQKADFHMRNSPLGGSQRGSYDTVDGIKYNYALSAHE